MSAIFDLYSRPIPTPVHNLRPSRGTCEQCHWPEQFSGTRANMITRYEKDEAGISAALQGFYNREYPQLAAITSRRGAIAALLAIMKPMAGRSSTPTALCVTPSWPGGDGD